MTQHVVSDEHRTRNRRLWRGIATALVARGVGLIAPLVLVPLTLGYLGAPTYAIWMSAASLTAMVVFADLGLGQGLMTILTPLLVQKEVSRARDAISATYSLLTVAATAGCVVIVTTGMVLDWATVLGAESPGPDDTAIATACLLMFVVNVPLSLVVRVQYAAQRVGAANLWQTAGSVCSLLLAFLGVSLDLGSLVVVVAALSGPLIGNVLASLWFYRQHPELAPRPALGGVREQLPDLGALGVGFLTLNVVMAVASNLDVIVVSHFDAPVYVVTFAIVVRLFGQVGSLVALVNVPLWPANAEAIARGDLAWVTAATKRMTLLSVGAVTALSIPLVAAGDALFDLWTGEDLAISRLLLAGAAAWWLLLGALSPRFMVQNSVGMLTPQLVGWICFLLTSVPLKIWAVSIGESDWVPLLGSAVGLVTILPGCVVGYRRALRGDLDVIGGGR